MLVSTPQSETMNDITLLMPVYPSPYHHILTTVLPGNGRGVIVSRLNSNISYDYIISIVYFV
jgi:hypothetical protein